MRIQMVLMVVILLGVGIARADETTLPKNPAYCADYLASKSYVTPTDAEGLCATYPMATLGCSMNMMDMGLVHDFYDALEYCLDPLVRP